MESKGEIHEKLNTHLEILMKFQYIKDKQST